MTLTYIWHDCFVLSTDTANIVFDYWKDSFSERGELPLFLKRMDKSKPLYVLVSHHHKDHYTSKIFEWVKDFPRIHYILSRDVAKFARHILNPASIYSGVKPIPDQVTVLKVGERYEDGNINVEAFGSTDIGNSYVVKVENNTYFHAGDLNAWIWKDESTQEEVDRAMGDFKRIVMEIASKYPEIDFAMFPVDSRIGTDYFTGAYNFVRDIFVHHFFPMHFGLGEDEKEQMKYQLDAFNTELYANKERGEYICLGAPYSEYSTADRR